MYSFVGIIPLAFGLAYYHSIVMSSFFRMKDFSTALFTMYYYMNGDASFDVLYGADQVNKSWTFFSLLVWLWFGNNVITNITLAIVEHGYLD